MVLLDLIEVIWDIFQVAELLVEIYQFFGGKRESV